MDDHSTSQINNTSNRQKEAFHIPVLWLGGALAVTVNVISSISYQLDLASALMAQLNINHPEDVYGTHMLSTYYQLRAYYSYGDDFGLVPDSISQFYNGELNAYRNQYPSDNHKIMAEQFVSLFQMIFSRSKG